MNDRVTVTISDGIADVVMNRPDKRNALDGEQFLAIARAGERLKSEPSVRAVVLSGAGSSFCAGLDFSSFQAMGSATNGDSDLLEADGSPGSIQPGGITHLGQQVCWVWQELAVPVIAAVHGHALGGGLQIALGADIRIVHPTTQLSVREVHWGLVPDMTGTLMLTQLVRPDIAKELTFSARVFDGDYALSIGLATSLSDSPYESAMNLARQIASQSPDAVRGSKALFNGLLHERAVAQFAAERRVISSLIGHPNQIEAIMANFEKRTPQFSDPSTSNG